MNHAALIGFGSNVGDSDRTYRDAAETLRQLENVQSIQVSRLIQTSPIGGPEQSNFSNGAFCLQTEMSAQELHTRLIEVENHLGRQRRIRWGPRSIDLDLLLFDQVILNSESLTIPHPRMSFRRFVLEPAAEIAPAMIHPICNQTIRQLLDHLNHASNELSIVCGPADENAARKALEILALKFGNWNMRTVHVDQLSQLPSSPRLVVFWEGAELEEPKWPGPQIWLSGNELDLAIEEISAAIEATLPLSSI